MSRVDPCLRNRLFDLIEGRLPWPLFLHGPAGCGKTCAALCVLDYASGMYYQLGDFQALLIRAMKGQEFFQHERGRDRWEVKEADIWTAVDRSPLFVLDELGSRSQVSSHHYDAAKKILDTRDRKPLIVLSNIGLEAMERLYDERVTSRLAAGTVLELMGVDRRLQKGD